MNVKYMNLSIPKSKEREVYLEALNKIMKHGMFILGEEVYEFEKQVSLYCGSKYSVGVGSGTDALILAMLSIGISKDDEVIIPDMSFIATANAVSILGAVPVFCDIKNDFNINYKNIENLITDKTKAIIPVHYGGKIADMDKILKIASKYKIRVIEDGSQAFGAVYKNKKAGAIGDIGCFSLNPMKTLGALGEAGIVTTNDYGIYKKLISMRSNGLDENKRCIYKGINAKIDTIQASFLSIKLKSLNENINKRNKIARYYTNKLKGYVQVPSYVDNNDTFNQDVYYSYTIMVGKKYRDKLFYYLLKNNIEAKINHTSMHKEPSYLSKHKNLDNSIKISKRKIALPCNENLNKKEIKFIVKKIKQFFTEEIYNEM
ncbi:DegT/DnrJ/EryC1/StrS family aminotransferase [Sulfurimonas sp.]